MGWEINTYMVGEATARHGLWKDNVKTGKYLPGGCQWPISCALLGLNVVMLMLGQFF